MKILSANQIKELDQFTIEHEPISSIDLMERAAGLCAERITALCNHTDEILIFCGKGNNGGDGLAIGRILLLAKYSVKIIIIHHNEKFSPDAEINYKKLNDAFPETIIEIKEQESLSTLTFQKNTVVVDALLGTGINKEVEGLLASAIDLINKSSVRKISIDVPSGLYIDKSSQECKHIIQANLCLTFQLPKLAFLLPENQKFVPEFEILNLDLSEEKILKSTTNFHYLSLYDVKSLIKKRSKFSHKGTYGHALLLAGSKGKSGAALIAAKACLRSGVGLLSVQSNKETLQALSSYAPEAMSIEDSNADFISEVNTLEKYDAIAFGPGVGSHEDTQMVLKKTLHYYAGNLVIDADGLNILSENKTWLNFLPADTILTPHPKEFARLVGETENDFERLAVLKNFSLKYNCIVILKGAHTAIAMPDGNIFFNSSGNAGLAKAGSGDGLTGIILGLLSRGYTAPQAAIIGTFVHGLTADLCAQNMSLESILISDVIDQLGAAFKMLE